MRPGKASGQPSQQSSDRTDTRRAWDRGLERTRPGHNTGLPAQQLGGNGKPPWSLKSKPQDDSAGGQTRTPGDRQGPRGTDKDMDHNPRSAAGREWCFHKFETFTEQGALSDQRINKSQKLESAGHNLFNHQTAGTNQKHLSNPSHRHVFLQVLYFVTHARMGQTPIT